MADPSDRVRGEFDCPECGRPSLGARGLGQHRSKAHGVRGTRRSSVAGGGLVKKGKRREPARARGRRPDPVGAMAGLIGEARRVGALDMVDGTVFLTAEIKVDMRELRKWDPQRQDRFFNGLAAALAAANE